jgi:hypothetical protein
LLALAAALPIFRGEIACPISGEKKRQKLSTLKIRVKCPLRF